MGRDWPATSPSVRADGGIKGEFIAKQAAVPLWRRHMQQFRIHACGNSVPDGMRRVSADVVSPDISLLLGLDLMDRLKLQLLSVHNVLEHVAADGRTWRLPVVRKHGHGYVECSMSNVIYFRSQLLKLHKHLYHPYSGKLLNLLKRATTDLVTSQTKELLEDIAASCQACQIYSGSPMNFTKRTPEEVAFNQELRIDLMFLGERKPVLHVVDAGTTFQAACFLEGEDANAVWTAFCRFWSHTMSGHPSSILCDQGSVFCRNPSRSCAHSPKSNYDIRARRATRPLRRASDIIRRCAEYISGCEQKILMCH
jgi:hypothetical protein